MIRRSFIFLDQIGRKLEKSFWGQGILTWEDFLGEEKIKGISPKRKVYYNRRLMLAHKNLYSFNSGFFYDILPKSEHWRLYNFFREDAVYLDIETSGYCNNVTVVGLYDGNNTKTMVKGINLDWKNLSEELKKYRMIVSFNGSSFDLPILNKCYPDLIPRIPHFDLRFACNRLGLNGGLKSVERQLSIKRPDELDGLQGADAVFLWRAYTSTGHRDYLEKLVKYNEEDIVNLRPIADQVYSMMMEKVLNG